MSDGLSELDISDEIKHTQTIGSEAISFILNSSLPELSHYGTLGMKWGVRKDRHGFVKARATMNRTSRKEASIMADVKTPGYRAAYNAIYKKAAGKIRQGTRQLNNDPRFKDQDFRKPSKLRSQYYREYSNMVSEQLNAATALKGVKGSKRLTMDWTFDIDKDIVPKATIRLKDTRSGTKEAKAKAKEIRRNVKHSDEPSFDNSEFYMDIEFDLDSIGHILDFHPSENMEHSDEIATDDELFHYGVLGMKWGVRNDNRSSNSSSSEPKTGFQQEVKGVPKIKPVALGAGGGDIQKALDEGADDLKEQLENLKDASGEMIQNILNGINSTINNINQNVVKWLGTFLKVEETTSGTNPASGEKYSTKTTKPWTPPGPAKDTITVKYNGKEYEVPNKPNNVIHSIDLDNPDSLYTLSIPNPNDSESNDLAHYGVLGMRWGVRNDDRGSGRPQGAANRKKAPIATIAKSSSSKTNEGNNKDNNNNSNSSNSSGSSSSSKEVVASNRAMTDQELRDAINRMQMEKTYAQLMAERNPAPAKKADSAIKRILGDSAKQAIGQILVNTAKVVGTYAIAAAVAKQNPALANALMKGVGDNVGKKGSEQKPEAPDATVTKPQTSQPKSQTSQPKPPTQQSTTSQSTNSTSQNGSATAPKTDTSKPKSSSAEVVKNSEIDAETQAILDRLAEQRKKWAEGK